MRNVLVFSAVLAMLLFLTACANNSIIAESANETITQKIADEQKCKTINCEANQQCSAGVCVCASGFKNCNGQCIPSNGCCSNSDCEEGKFCGDKNVCKSFQKQCSYNQAWSAVNETCECVAGTKFCEAQNKCVPNKNCCTFDDCTLRRDLCLDTNYAASICINDGVMHCKSIVENHNELFALKNNTYFRVHINSIVENGNTNIVVNKNISKILKFNSSTAFEDGRSISVNEIKELGGVCKSYNAGH